MGDRWSILRLAAVLIVGVASGCADARLLEPGDDTRLAGPSNTPNVDGGPSTSEDTGVDAGQTSDASQPSPDGSTVSQTVCEDTLSGTGVVAGPAGLMIQVPSIADTCELERALDHVCRAHQDDIQDLVLTSVETWSNGDILPVLDTRVLDVIAPYLDCFDNVFVGTMSEVLIDNPYAPETINDPDERWRWLRAAQEVAVLMAAWMDANTTREWHWYISYEANLNAFTDTEYRNAYVAMLQQHITDITALNPGVVAWSPTFWTAPTDLSDAQRTSLESALANLFDRVPVDWVLIQDHLGVQPNWVCSDALAYYDMVRAAAPQLDSVQLNVEYFTINGAAIRAGDPAELAARVECYRAGGASLGASFETRYWYENHGH